MVVGLLFGTFIVLIALGMPIGYSIGLATLITILMDPVIPTNTVAQTCITGVDSFPLMAVPFFMLAGNLMSCGGISRRIIHLCECLFGRFSGGLSIVTIVACMFFAALSGSAVATTSGIGSFMIPAMDEKGYDRGFAASVTAAAGSIGVIIPPSIPFVIYGVSVNCSIGDLFIAGFLPGIMMGVSLIVMSLIYCKKNGYGGNGKKITGKELWHAFLDSILALLMPVIILGGIYSGIFTPTESAVVACVYCIIVSCLIYREMKLKDLYNAFVDTVVVNGITTFMVGLSMGFAVLLNLKGIPNVIADFILGITDNKILVLLMINIFLLFVGAMIDNIPATIILAPILLPIVTQVGMDPITFGIMLTMNLAIGFVTPPYGINLFVASAISKVPIMKMMRTTVWCLVALLIVLTLVTYVPAFTMFAIQ